MSEENNSQKSPETVEEIYKTGSVSAEKNGGIECLTVIGQIEGHYILGENQKATKYEHLIPLLVSLENNDEVKGVLIVLNTMGGDVEAGLAIAEMIASMKKPTVSLVLGGGHSIGVPLAVAAKRSFIVPSATMTLHPVRVNGLVVGAPQTYRYLRDMQNRIVDFVCRNSGVKKERLEELMMKPDALATDVGTIVDGREAVSLGLIDEVGGLDSALAALAKMQKQETPNR